MCALLRSSPNSSPSPNPTPNLQALANAFVHDVNFVTGGVSMDTLPQVTPTLSPKPHPWP